jgi:NADPH2:quinone reductase
MVGGGLGGGLALDLQALAPGGTVVTYAATGPDPVVPVRPLMSRNLNLRFMLIYTIPGAALRAAVEEVNAAVAAGSLTELPSFATGSTRSPKPTRQWRTGPSARSS